MYKKFIVGHIDPLSRYSVQKRLFKIPIYNTMITRRYKFILLGIVGFVLLVALFFYRFHEQDDIVTPLLSDLKNQNEVLQTHEEQEQLQQRTEQEPNSTHNNVNESDNIDIEDIEFLFDDVVDSVNWEWFQSKLKDPKQVVKIRTHGSISYYQLAQAFDQNDLPEFYEILNDDKSSGYERIQAINFIGHISDRGNQEAAKVLMDYAQKPVNWDKWRSDAYYITVSKWISLTWLGYVGGEPVEKFLTDAIVPEGAIELAEQWYKGVPEAASSKESILNNLRGFAAKGLAYSDDPAVHELVRAEYEKEKQACIEAGKHSGGYFNQLIEAMTRIDIIKDIGMEGHKALSDGKGSYANMYLKYQVKYIIKKPSIDFNDIKIQF